MATPIGDEAAVMSQTRGVVEGGKCGGFEVPLGAGVLDLERVLGVMIGGSGVHSLVSLVIAVPRLASASLRETLGLWQDNGSGQE